MNINNFPLWKTSLKLTRLYEYESYDCYVVFPFNLGQTTSCEILADFDDNALLCAAPDRDLVCAVLHVKTVKTAGLISTDPDLTWRSVLHK